ncbi:MAG TPA: GNAT family N-acetyltransferase [Magnetospirillum sp.]|nr:GNAT family N-acetyltransferase [Magnetospirillum sp.]
MPHGLVGPANVIQMETVLGQEPSPKAYALALDHLLALIKVFGGAPLIADPLRPDGLASSLGQMCLKRGLVSETLASMEVDLTRPEAELWKAIRSSYRPLISKGKRIFSVRYLNRDTLDWSLFDIAAELHHRYVDQRTPLFRTRAAIAAFVADGNAELAVIFHGQDPVGFILTLDEGDVSAYAVARYPRDSGLPVAPFSLWNAICRRKAEGRKWFHLGFADNESEKLRNISYFKSGLTDIYRYRHFWRVAESG